MHLSSEDNNNSRSADRSVASNLFHFFIFNFAGLQENYLLPKTSGHFCWILMQQMLNYFKI